MPDPNPAGSAEGDKKRVTLALQGGGAHGAFTWGVLDRLAEEPSFDIQAISGTSAGALNAAVFAHGFAQNGAAGAKQKLQDFWRSVSDAGNSVFNPYSYLAEWPMLAPYVSLWVNVLSQVWSPYDNFFYTNRLKPLLEEAIDFKKLSHLGKPALFICATNVRTNQRKIFHGEELSVDVLLASACLPSLFQAIGVKGNDYWDGGYMGNPVLSPLIPFADDMVIVEVNPINRKETPHRAADIMDRLNEITFNSALVREIAQINLLNRLIGSGELKSKKYKAIRFHVINAEEKMSAYPEYTKSETSWGFLTELKALGRDVASKWLSDSGQFGNVGERTSFDVEERLIRRLNTHPAAMHAS